MDANWTTSSAQSALEENCEGGYAPLRSHGTISSHILQNASVSLGIAGIRNATKGNLNNHRYIIFDLILNLNTWPRCDKTS